MVEHSDSTLVPLTDASPLPAEVRRWFEEAFANVKSKDAAIVDMYQQFGDQVAENAGIVREIGSRD